MARQKKQTGRSSGIRFTILIGIVVLLYILPRVFHFAGSESNRYIIAQSGRIEDTITLSGVITREEQLFKAVSDGIVEYYYPGGRLLSKNTIIATIQDADYYGSILSERKELINQKMAELSAEDTEYAEEFSSLSDSLETQVRQFLKEKNQTSYSTTYDLKNTLTAAVHQRQDLYSLLSGATARSLLEEQELYQNVEDETKDTLWISEAGIISYSYDGYEGWDASMIDEDFIADYNSQYDFLNINLQQVEKGDPLYRLITDQSWYVTTFLSKDEAASLDLTEATNLALYDGDKKLTAYIESLEQTASGSYKMVLRMQARLLDYVDQRLIRLTLQRDAYEGMKVPNTCLTEEYFYQIPNTCVYRSGKNYGVMVRQNGEDTFLALNFEWNDDADYYLPVAEETLTEGMQIIEAGSGEIYTVRAPKAVYGVYITGGTSDQFKHVELLYKGPDYSIITGISLYDHVKVLS